MQKLLLSLVGPLLLSPQDALPFQKKPSAPPPGVSVRLNLKEKKETGLVAQCVLANKSEKPVVAHTGYDGSKNVLYGAALTLRRRKASPLKRVIVKAGGEQVLFEIPLKQTFHVDPSTSPKPSDREWRWGWRRRLAPPNSPFHAPSRVGGFVPTASFWVATQIEDAPVVSKKVVLKLKITVQFEIKPEAKP